MGALDGRTVLVTGGASGIGKACVNRYRQEGGTVFVADINPQADQIALDVGDPDGWRAVIESLPPLDVVHLNAGITTPGRNPRDTDQLPLNDVSDTAYRAIVGTNLDGVFFGARAVLPAMTERGVGDIVITASMAGLSGMPGDIAYTATKHAVVGLVKSLAATLTQQGHDICVSALCPGFVDTPLLPREALTILGSLGLPIISSERVADAAMHALDVRVNGSQWVVWGDVIRQYVPADLI